MGTFLLLCMVAVAACLVIGVIATLVGAVLRAVFWIVTLPFRILFKVVFGLGGLLLGILFAPVVVVIAIIGAVVAIATTVLPILPVLLLGGFGWAVYRLGWKKQSTPPPLPPQSFWN